MFALRVAKLAATKAGAAGYRVARPSMYAAFAGSLIWLCVDLADGASDRFHVRLEQAKAGVVDPAESAMEKTTVLVTKLWDSIESNPGPSLLALALFIITVVYHKRRGTSTVEALKATLLKTHPAEPVNPILEKIQREALEGQMLDAFDRLEKRSRDLPDEITAAKHQLQNRESVMNKTNEAAERARNEKLKAQAYYDRLVREQAEGAAAMKELEVEMSKAA